MIEWILKGLFSLSEPLLFFAMVYLLLGVSIAQNIQSFSYVVLVNAALVFSLQMFSFPQPAILMSVVTGYLVSVWLLLKFPKYQILSVFVIVLVYMVIVEQIIAISYVSYFDLSNVKETKELAHTTNILAISTTLRFLFLLLIYKLNIRVFRPERFHAGSSRDE